jgi:hypothetical protein
MPIAVICPGCKAQFRVSDKFAGKQGPCPKCKVVITIPAASTSTDEVKIHAPEEYASAGKDMQGRAVAKPLPRVKTRFNPTLAVAIVAGTFVTFGIAFLAGTAFRDNVLIRLAGLLVVSPPLVVGGYMFMRNPEDLMPHQGRALWLRSSICALVYVALWIGFYFVPQALMEEYWSMFYLAPPFMIAGGIAALACLDLDFGNAFFHYCFYLVVTVLLRFTAGIPVPWGPADITS